MWIGIGDYVCGIYEISGWLLCDVFGYFDGLMFDGVKCEIVDKVIKEIVVCLMFLNNVGFDYLLFECSVEILLGGEV